MPNSLTENILSYIAERRAAKQDALDKERNKALAALVSAQDHDNFDAEYTAKQAKLDHDFTVANWLDGAAKRAGQISMATHAIKFTHGSAKGSNILCQDLGSNEHYLQTSDLSAPATDAVGNAAALDVAKLLQLTDHQEKSLLDYLKEQDITPLQPLAQNDQQSTLWLEGLSQALNNDSPQSHTLAKQIYFPIGDNQYHLLAPLYSSSLSQAIYDEVQHARFSQEMKQIREARKKELACDDILIAYPNLAQTMAGGSKPQNISQLNNRRGGKTYLFNSCPPYWQSQIKTPQDTETLLNHSMITYHTKTQVEWIAQYMAKKRLQDSNKNSRDYIDKLVNEIGEDVVALASTWQQLPAGWSNNLKKLPLYQAQWLDPHNPRWQEENEDWRGPLSLHFGQWLKDRVQKAVPKQDSNYLFILGQGEADEWRQLFKQLLWEINA